MSKLKDIIKSADDLLRQCWEVPDWPNPEGDGGVMLELRTPSVKRRSGLLKAFTNESGEIDMGAMQLALVKEMVFDPEAAKGEEDTPLFDEDDMEWLEEKSGSAVWGIAQECMFIAGFQEREDGSGEGAETDLVEAGKASS